MSERNRYIHYCIIFAVKQKLRSGRFHRKFCLLLYHPLVSFTTGNIEIYKQCEVSINFNNASMTYTLDICLQHLLL